MNNSSSSSISSLVPGGVVTTQNISTVIKPKENNNSMQFVKIQTPELSKKAVEQIRVAQESKITKDKIKEVEEEWQSNLLNWKSKRRQQFVGTHSNDQDEQNNNQNENENGRKIKTFAEMLEERTKTGNRLNFNLERYIGSSESDNYESEQDYQDKTDFIDKEISQLSLTNSDNNHSNHHQHRPHNSNNSHNNLSNLLDRNGRTNSNNNNNHSSNNDNFLINKNSQPVASNANNVDSGLLFGHGDHYENGVANEQDDDFDDRPLNSTFKQGVGPPPTPPTIHSDDRIRPTLDVDTLTKEVSSARYEDNGSDHDEEEDEQEEEQKHAQRIAFVAKLKAFEKMTQPSLNEPKFVAPKLNKAPPPPPPLAPSRSTQVPQIQTASPLPASPPILTPPIRNRQQIQQQAPAASVSKVPEAVPSKKTIPEVPSSVSQSVHLAQTQITSSAHLPLKQLPSNYQDFSKTNNNKQPLLAQEPSAQAQPVTPIRKQQPPPPLQALAQPIPTTSSPKQHQPSSPQILPPKFNSQAVPQLSSAPQTLPSPIPPPSPQRQHIHMQQQQQQQQQQSQQPQPQPQAQQAPPRHQSQPQSRAPLKDDKSQDGTVLSVSGKKRCSSCKEELGRGAAAFVIESLNLVYHTNCFRCSVCHVNLSNGFRGVDVRVHAGALHCQNCYSKDGLNYSRV